MNGRGAPVFLAVVLSVAACSTAPSPSPSASWSASGQPSATATPFGTTSPTDTAAPTASPSPPGVTYAVQAGDTLSSIARAWGTTIQQLQSWNAERYPSLASDPNALQAGWVLTVSGDPGTTPQPTVAPTRVPTPAPTVAPTGCSAGNRVAAGSAQTFSTIPGAGHSVALTLDMGGRLDPGVDILNFLIANQVCATIFPTGAMAQTTGGQEVMAIIKAHPELFEVGNHTMHHCNLVSGGGGSPTTAPCATGGAPSAQFIKDELTDAAAILKQLSGQDPVPYWRAPYGSINSAVLSAAASVGYTKTFMWDIDTIDWKPIGDGGPTAQQIATKVISRAVDGSIVLMHLGGYETLDALEIMVPGLRDRGFGLTSLSDMLN
ncbi:MAG TPA: polysaccharide deacetylase family protein [Gemmatimonadales bacterium]|nr:polysaccharide deacetylase family protein [Gemmatimonadales bacterium]